MAHQTFWKPLPRACEKVAKHRQDRRSDGEINAKVRAFHGHRCKVCLKRGSLEVHEEKRRGAGGVRSLENSYPVCVPPTGSCHRLLQYRHIYAERADGNDRFDAREPLVFTMSRRVADQVFPNGQIPPHVHVIPDGI